MSTTIDTVSNISSDLNKEQMHEDGKETIVDVSGHENEIKETFSNYIDSSEREKGGNTSFSSMENVEIVAPFPPKVAERVNNETLELLNSRNSPTMNKLLDDFIRKAEETLEEKNILDSSNIELIVESEPENKSSKWITIVIEAEIDSQEERMRLWEEIEEENQKVIENLRENTIEHDQEKITVADALISTWVIPLEQTPAQSK